MPSLLRRTDEAAWLGVRGVRGRDALVLWRPYLAAELEAVSISPPVDSPANDDLACVAPLRAPATEAALSFGIG